MKINARVRLDDNYICCCSVLEFMHLKKSIVFFDNATKIHSRSVLSGSEQKLDSLSTICKLQWKPKPNVT